MTSSTLRCCWHITNEKHNNQCLDMLRMMGNTWVLILGKTLCQAALVQRENCPTLAC